MRLEQDINAEEQQPVKRSFCRSLRKDFHWKCLILTLLIYGCLGAIAWCRLTVVTKVIVNFYDMPITRMNRASPCEDGYVYIPVAFVVMLYMVYLVECWHCHTRIELHYKVDVNAVYERVQAMREALPIVWWKAVCYHYVRRTRQVTRYRNGDAFTTTQVYYERVNSHTASSAFNFTNCGIKDISKKLINLENFPATKIRFSKGFSFATLDAEQEFEEQRAQFFQEHERRDDYMETREGLDLLNINFKEYMIAFADPDNLPWYASHVVFWLASLVLLSWPLRVLIEYKTAYVHYHVHKLFGCSYLDSSYCLGQMSRVSTMGSSELEYTIRNNYTIVPSYSEALLMEAGAAPDANGNTAVTTPNGSIQMVPLGGAISAYANGHMSNGHIPQETFGALQYGTLQNGTVVPLNRVILQRRDIASADNIPGQIQYKRRRKKRKRRRHSYSETTALLSDTDGAPSCSQTRTSIPPVTTPDSLSELTIANSVPRKNDMRTVTSCFEIGERAHRPANGESSMQTSVECPDLPAGVSPPREPPSYEDALGMRPAARLRASSRTSLGGSRTSLIGSGIDLAAHLLNRSNSITSQQLDSVSTASTTVVSVDTEQTSEREMDPDVISVRMMETSL